MAGGDVCSSESFNEDIAVFSKQVILVFFELITFNLPRKLKHEWSAPLPPSAQLRAKERKESDRKSSSFAYGYGTAPRWWK